MVQFKGIIRGVYSENQHDLPGFRPVIEYKGNTLKEAIDGLVLREWIFTLRVNGWRITNPERYLKRKGLWNERGVTA